MATFVALALLGAPVAGAEPQLPPGITLPPRASDTSTTTTVTPEPTTTVAPAPAPTATTAPPAGETKIIPLPQETKIVDPARPGGAATTTVRPGDPASQVQVPSLSPGQVDDVLRNLQRSGASSTAALVDALRPLQNVGMTLQEALALGMGQFPLLGVANWTDDWLDPRAGPPPHAHQGNDLFAAFDIPVRSPIDGIVRFEDAGLGGKGAFVTAPDGTYFYLAHLSGFSRDVASGSAVKQGQIIGYNGDSGNAKGGPPHVHFEIHPKGGAAINPKPILDGWVADALAKAPALVASFQPKPVADAGSPSAEGGVPQILVATGITRRFSPPAMPLAGRDRPGRDYNQAVLGPLTPSALAPLLER